VSHVMFNTDLKWSVGNSVCSMH